MSNLPKIHFILPGGGVRGAFQAGFLYQLFTKYRDYFEIARVDGTSVGSLNGFFTMNNKLNELRDIWLNINSINDLFENWSDQYIVGALSSYYHGFYKNGLFSNKKINDILKLHSENNWSTYSTEYKDKYSCIVTNMKNASSVYIYGSNVNVADYVTASASPWIISNPVTIDNIPYSDGCLLETYPIKHIHKCNADITLIVGYDQEHINYIDYDNSNILTYLANLIDISRFNSKNIECMRELLKNENVIGLANPMKLLISDINKDSICDGFHNGIQFADNFYNTFLSSD